MPEQTNAKDRFNSSAFVEFLKNFTTPASQKQALDTVAQTERATAAAQESFRKTLSENLAVPGRDFDRRGIPSERGQEKRNRVYAAHAKCLQRIGNIERASDNRLKRIQAQQQRQEAGRKFRDDFNRSR